MTAVFLSAGIPDPARNKVYGATVDLIRLRDAVSAVVTRTLQTRRLLVTGGQPAVYNVLKDTVAKLEPRLKDWIETYQSAHFVRNQRARDAARLAQPDLVWVEQPSALTGAARHWLDAHRRELERVLARAGAPSLSSAVPPGQPPDPDLVEALLLMRLRMLRAPNEPDRPPPSVPPVPIGAAVFVGGMEGIEHEFHLVRSVLPSVPVMVLGSTGAGAKIVLEREGPGLGLKPTEIDHLQRSDLYDVLLDDLP